MEDILWAPHPGPQTEVLRHRVYELLFGGSRGGGKTEAGQIFLLLDDYHLNPLYRALVIRKNSDDLHDWVDRAERFYANEGAIKTGNPVEFTFPSGAKIRTGHLKDADAYTKYQGHEYHRMLIEELTQIAREQDYEMLLGSCRSTVPGLVPGVFATTNPNGKGHVWVKNRFVKGKVTFDGQDWAVPTPGTVWVPPNTKRPRLFLPARIWDNPTLLKNDPGYINYLKGLPPNLREMWLNGSWDIGAGQYFDEWDENVHVCENFEIPDKWQLWMCLDYGYEHRSAVYWNATDPQTGKVYTYRELYVQHHTYEMLTEAIARMTPDKEKEKIDWMVADSSIVDQGKETGRTGIDLMRDVFEKHNWQLAIRLADKRPRSRLNGWNLMRGYLRIQRDELGNPKTRWQVFRDCVNLIRTMPLQIFDENNIEDLDSDGEDDAQDAMRYGFRAVNEPWDKKPEAQKPKQANKTLTNEELFYKIEGDQYGR